MGQLPGVSISVTCLAAGLKLTASINPYLEYRRYLLSEIRVVIVHCKSWRRELKVPAPESADRIFTQFTVLVLV